MIKYGWTAKGLPQRLLLSFLLLSSFPAQASIGDGDGSRSAAERRAGLIDRWAAYIDQASARFGIPADWIRRVMHAESRGRTLRNGRPITSRAGAMGLMQLMPGTWAEMRARYGLGTDPHDPRDNILAGAAYLRAMYDRFGHPGLFAAYNAGPARYAEHLAGGRPLPAETIAYAATVGAPYTPAVASSPNEPTQSGLFVSLRNTRPDHVEAPESLAGRGPLFVPLSIASTPAE